MAIHFWRCNSVVVENLTLTDTRRSSGLAVDGSESFTMTNSVLGMLETAISFMSKYFLDAVMFIHPFPLPKISYLLT